MSKSPLNVKTVTSNYTTTPNDDIIIADTTGGSFTITLYSSPTPGSIVQIIKTVSANVIVVNGSDATTPYLSNITNATYVSLNGVWTHQSTSRVTAVSVSDIQSLISGTAVSTDKQYIITNPQQGGSILIKGINSNQLDYNATWLRPTLLYPFGWVRLTGGASGSVDSITVNSISITTASVPFTTSLNNTASLVVANINANTSTSGFRAVSILDTIVVIGTTTTSSLNGQTVSGTATTITLGNSQALTNGATSTTQQLKIEYDITSDRIRNCTDPIRNINISLSERVRALLATDPFNEFRWGENQYSNIILRDTLYQNNFVANTATFRGIDSNSGQIIGNIIINGGSIRNIKINPRLSTTNGLGLLNNNLILSTTSLIDGCNIELGVCGNILTGTSSFMRGIYQFTYGVSTATTIGVCNNVLSGNNASISGINQQYNTGGGSLGVNSNILSGNNTLITAIFQSGYGACTVNSNTLSTQFQFIRNIQMLGRDCTVSSNTISTGTSNIGITDIVLTGRSTSINSNTIANSTLGISNIVLSGQSASINNMNFAVSSNMNNIVLAAQNAIITGYTFDATMTLISNLDWSAANIITMQIASPTLTGATNLGLSGSNINLGLIPIIKAYPIRATFEGSGLTGVGASLELGIETDSTANIMPITAITSLNTLLNSTVTLSKSTVTNRRIVAIPSGANITAGSFQVFVEFQISKY